MSRNRHLQAPEKQPAEIFPYSEKVSYATPRGECAFDTLAGRARCRMTPLQAAAWPDAKFRAALKAAGHRIVLRGQTDVVLGRSLS